MVEKLTQGWGSVGEMRVLSAGGDSESGKLVGDVSTRVVGVARYVI